MKRFVVLVLLAACANAPEELPGLMLNMPPARAGGAMASPEPSTPTTLVEHEVWALHDRLIDCVATPRTCEVHEFTSAGSTARHDLHHFVQRRRLDGLEARVVSHPPARRMLRSWASPPWVHVEMCWVDDLILATAASEHGRSVTVDDSAVTLTEAWTLTAQDGEWRFEDRHLTRTDQGRAAWCR